MAIEELREEVEKGVTIDREQKQIIKILKEGKEYYCEEYKKNTVAIEAEGLQQRVREIQEELERAEQKLKWTEGKAKELTEMVAVKDNLLEAQQKQLEAIVE